MDTRTTRRRLLELGAVGLIAMASAACGGREEKAVMRRDRRQGTATTPAAEGRLLARPSGPRDEESTRSTSIGPIPLGLGAGRDGLLYIPRGYSAREPAPLALMLHGAGGNAHHGLGPLQNLADDAGLILLSPDSRRQTWDVILGSYGPDIAFLDRVLEHTFSNYAVDPEHVAVGGFSDGASYALSVGVTNGDLFTHVLAFSPGFLAPAAQEGRPRLYISHGTQDRVLPIDACSRRIVPAVQQAGYDVLYREFEGPHTVPPEIAREATGWFLGQ